MVKLSYTQGKYRISVPMDKAKRKGWKGGEEFDVEFDHQGNMVFVEIKA